MNKKYFKFENLNYLLKKNYIFLAYNFINVNSILINNIKKKFQNIRFFFCNGKILKIENVKNNINLIIVENNFELLCEIIVYISNFLEIKPFFLLNYNIKLEKLPIKEISNLSKNNLILELLKSIKLNFLKLIKIIKKYEQFINK